jgi:transposase InsO family protein
MGVLPRAPGGFRFLFVVIDMFTKWMEAMLVVNITQETTVKFLQSIAYRFGVQKWVLIDNGTRFKRAKFARCCSYFGIKHQPSLATHPQMNGQVKRANRLILQGMNTRIFSDPEEKRKNWHKELPSILWALHSNINRATRDTSFHLVYGADAVLPPEIFLESARLTQFNGEDQAKPRKLDSNLLEEKGNKALANVRKHQESLNHYYNNSVVLRELEIGDLVLKKDIRTKDKHLITLGRTIHNSGHSSTRGLCASRS